MAQDAGRAGPPSRPAPLPFLLRRFIFPPKEGSLLGFSIPPQSLMLPNISPHHPQCGRLNPGKTGPTDPCFTTRCHPRATHEPAAAQARTRTCAQHGQATSLPGTRRHKAAPGRGHRGGTSLSPRVTLNDTPRCHGRSGHTSARFLPRFRGEMSTRRPCSSEMPRRRGRRCRHARKVAASPRALPRPRHGGLATEFPWLIP